MITMFSRFLRKGSLFFFCSLICRNCISQNYHITKLESFKSSVLVNRGFWTFFNDVVENDQKSKLQILFIQFGDRKLTKSYYLKVGENNQEFRIVFSRDSIFESKLGKIKEQPSFFTKTDTSLGVYLIDSDAESSKEYPKSVSSHLLLKEADKYLILHFINTPVEETLGKVESFSVIKSAFELLKTKFEINIYTFLDK